MNQRDVLPWNLYSHQTSKTGKTWLSLTFRLLVLVDHTSEKGQPTRKSILFTFHDIEPKDTINRPTYTMESAQAPQSTATRPPLPHRPPARMDRERSTGDRDKRRDAVPDVDISRAYRRRSLKHRIECGHRVKTGPQEIEELKQSLGTRKCQMYSDGDSMTSCVVCGDQCLDGEFAVETVLFIPNKNDAAYAHLGRFRVELPRIACHDCAKEDAAVHGIEPNSDSVAQSISSLAAVWTKYQSHGLKQVTPPKLHAVNSQRSNSTKSSGTGRRGGSADLGDHKESALRGPAGLSAPRRHSNEAHRGQQQQHHTHQHHGHQRPNHGHQAHGHHAHHGHHGHGHHHQHQGSSQKVAMPMEEPERDPFDDGFLICTQLVKTGGADQGGLQGGDVFVQFGQYHLKRFPGLQAIANLVRRSAGKEIKVMVWRKLEVEDPSLFVIF